jgi:hypothetical protein
MPAVAARTAMSSPEISPMAWLPAIESSAVYPGSEAATPPALQHNHQVVAAFLIKVQVEQPQLQLPESAHS